MNVAALKKRLGEISTKNKKTNTLWKPSGKHVIRIVPLKENPENPFLELKFHYGLNNKNFLSPITNGRPDPVVELANQLQKTGDSDDYNLGKKLFPKLRVYVPVIVRGEEDQGVRYWGFGKQVYQTLLGIVADDDYGDITDINDGNDINVEYLSKEDTGKDFPETQIRPRPKKTPVGDKQVLQAIKDQPAISDIFSEPTYEELKAELDAYLNPEAGEVDASAEAEADVGGSDSSVDTSVTEAKTAPKAVTSVKESEDAFNQLFGS
jgi:hypothetical protein